MLLFSSQRIDTYFTLLLLEKNLSMLIDMVGVITVKTGISPVEILTVA